MLGLDDEDETKPVTLVAVEDGDIEVKCTVEKRYALMS